MLEIMTRDYGTVQIDESAVIRFEDGIIGFEDYRDYVLLDDGSGQSPFRCLQSIDESELAFILIDPFSVKPDYELAIDDALSERLSIASGESAAVFAIVVVPEDVKKMSFNLKAPLIINADLKIGAQYIVDRSDYGVRHLIFEELERSDGMRLCDSQKAV